MFTYVKLLLLPFLTILIGCSSFHSKLQNAQIGMTKKQALKKFNEPQEKYRTKGHDHWVYETLKRAKDKSQGKLPFKHILIFEEGILIDVSFERAFTEKELQEFHSK